MVVTVLIQADLLVYQAAAATVISAAVGTAGTGGLLQSPVPTHGHVDCTTATASALSAET